MLQFPRPAFEPPIFSEGLFQETVKRHAHFHLLSLISPFSFGVICLIHCGIALVADYLFEEFDDNQIQLL